MSEKKGFFRSLFNLSFAEFITPRVIKFMYCVAVFWSATGAGAMVYYGFKDGSNAFGTFTLILSPVIFFLLILFSRVWLEMIIVAFRIAENTGRLIEQNEPG